VNQPPSAIAEATPISGDAPLTVDFVGSGSTDDTPGLTFSWDFGDGGGATIPDPSYTYTQPGNYSALLTVTDAGGLQDSDQIAVSITDPNIQRVVSFTLVNNSNPDEDLFELTDGMQIQENITQGLSMNIRANTNPAFVGSVFLSISGPINSSRNENVAPYALFGDSSGDYHGNVFPPGLYTVSATPYSGSSRSGIQGQSLTIQFSINQASSKSVPTGTDSIGNSLIGPDSNLITQENNSEMNQILVHPNPARSYSIVSYPERINIGKVQIYSINGQLIREEYTGEIDRKYGELHINVRDLEEGIYLLYLWSQDLPNPFRTKLLVHKNK
jgi:PKD repeat protein